MKNRLVRVEEIMKRELGQILERDLSFRESLVTVQHVDMTPDLRNCHVFISVYGAADNGRSVIAKLEKDRVSIQKAISKRVILKFTPRLHFKFDHSIERGDRIVQLLSELDVPTDDDVPAPAPDQPEKDGS